MATALTDTLDRRVLIRATPPVVFRFFTDSTRWAAWWGAGSSIDPRVGGRLLIRYPDGTEATGEILEIVPPMRLVFTYGYATGTPIAPGGSRVEIRLEPDPEGTRLFLTHAFSDPAVRDQHVQGWRYQLSLFANLVSDEVNADASARIDAWFDAWSIADVRARATAIEAVASPDVEFRDRYSAVSGIADLNAHISGAQRFMPGVRPKRSGPVRHCQGLALADWSAVSADGQSRGSGTNVFVFAAEGLIGSVTGFWN